MINPALTFIADELDAYIAAKTGTSGTVLLNALVAPDGSTAAGIAGKLTISLVNIEEERVMKAQSPYSEPSSGGIVSRINPEIKVNLYALFAGVPDATATAGAYDTSLTLVSHVISFFQSRNDFNLTNSPNLDPQIKHLKADLYTLPIEQQNYLWGALGAKYMPSVIYRLRLLTFQEEQILGSGQQIEIIDTQVGE